MIQFNDNPILVDVNSKNPEKKKYCVCFVFPKYS